MAVNGIGGAGSDGDLGVGVDGSAVEPLRLSRQPFRRMGTPAMENVLAVALFHVLANQSRINRSGGKVETPARALIAPCSLVGAT